MTARPLRGAVNGCGAFAVDQLLAWRSVPGADFLAICDRDPDRLALVGGRFGITHRVVEAEALLAGETLDFVNVVTMVVSHRPLVELAARRRTLA